MEESIIVKRYIDFLISKGDLKFGWNENITEYISLEYLEQSNMVKIIYLDDNKLYDKYVDLDKNKAEDNDTRKNTL